MDRPRLDRAQDRILAILLQCGTKGATTWELIDATRHSAAARRVWDLQQEGHRIDKVSEGNGVFRWIYRAAPTPQKERLTQTTLLDLIRSDDAQFKAAR